MESQKGSFDFKFPRIEIPKPDLLHIKNHTHADTFYERIKAQIEGIEKELKKGEALIAALYLANGEVIQIEDIGYHNPYLMVFYGRDSEDRDCNILTHMNAVQLTLKIVSIEVEKPRPRIGFISQD